MTNRIRTQQKQKRLSYGKPTMFWNLDLSLFNYIKQIWKWRIESPRYGLERAKREKSIRENKVIIEIKSQTHRSILVVTKISLNQ